MTADSIVFFLVCWGAACSTSFTILYPVLSRGWRKTWIGWGLLTSSCALALSLNLIVVGKVFGIEYPYAEYIRVGAFGLIAAGATLKLTALLREKYRAMRADRV